MWCAVYQETRLLSDRSYAVFSLLRSVGDFTLSRYALETHLFDRGCSTWWQKEMSFHSVDSLSVSCIFCVTSAVCITCVVVWCLKYCASLAMLRKLNWRGTASGTSPKRKTSTARHPSRASSRASLMVSLHTLSSYRPQSGVIIVAMAPVCNW